jgi:muramoyltetrapeptide carboxypeptidase LdcA involved in peptidoglycan recycling
MKPLIKPPRLRQGDLIGLIAPAGHTNDSAIEKAVRNIEALGFRVKLGRYLREVYGNYAGSVEMRLADLHGMFLDPEIKGLWCIRGGSGGISLLKHIDYAMIRRHPKVLLGYSDITALHLAILRHARVVTPPDWNPDVKAYSIFNASVNYTGFKNLTLTAGIKNLFDQDQPFAVTYDSNSGAGSTWEPRVADPRGRSYTLQANYKFF